MKLRIFIIIALIGILFGVGGYTFYYAHGLSYLSTDSKACVNCHVMRPQYENWIKSSHHAVAGCSDCHMPTNSFFAKYLTKAENGYLHSKAFTLQNFHEPIQIRDRNKRVLNRQCLTCHADLAEHVAMPRVPADELDQCTRCHSSVGH